MTQPSPASFLHEGETASPPRWRGPPYHDLRIAKLACVDGCAATTKSSGASDYAASRSPSPSVTPSESSNYYAASTSSWATSAGPGTEYGFPNDDETERCGNKWDDDFPRMSLDRPPTPAGRVARFVSRLPARPSSRQSSLRNAVSVRSESEAETPCLESQETDTSESECDTAKKSDDETETDSDDNEWSGQNGNLESVVIAAVDGDLALAAHLIPLLHRDFSLSLKSKVESWQCTAAHGDDDESPGGSGDKTSYTETSPDQSPGISRKRRRTTSDGRGKRGVGGWDGEDGDDEDDGKGPDPSRGEEDPQRMLACPFHKRDSAKYGIQHGNSGSGKKHRYRACMGPGFKSVQRLKEHLKRVHSPVQCERCHEIFPGTDRAACLSRLAEHRKMNVSCELGDPSMKEGIDEAQWAALDKQNRKKNQETHRVEKWFEIWDVLFPGVPRPRSPWHDASMPQLASFHSSSKDAEYFADLFLNIMDHKVKHGDIDLSDPKHMRDGVKSVARTTFKTYINLHGKLTPETSSGESQNRLSLAGGSSTHLSDPATAGSHQLTATTANTSISGGHGSPSGRPPNSYTLNSSFGMRIPRGMANQPRQYMAAPSLAQVPAGTDMAPPIQPSPLQANGLPAFGGMSPGDPAGGYYYPYMFPPPQNSWAPNNAVAFPPSHMAGMTPDFSMGGANFFGEAQNFGAGPAEGG